MSHHNPEKRAFRGRSYRKGGTPMVELKERNRRVMFGANDEAFPSEEEWSRIVD